MTGEYRQTEDPEAVAAQAQWQESVGNVIEPMRTAYGKKMERLFGTSPSPESPAVPEEHVDHPIVALQEGAQQEYRDLLSLTRLTAEESDELQTYLRVPYESLTHKQGRFDILRARAAGLAEEEITQMTDARQRLHEAIVRGEARSPELDRVEQTYLRIWDKAKAQWENLSQSA